MKHTIWSNVINVEDWKDDIKEQYPDIDENEIYEVAYRENEVYFDDEKANLDKELGNNIVIVADLGLWNGRRAAHKFVGTNLNSVFSGTCGDYVTWYVEDGEIKCEDSHHDGTNYYVYRLLKPNISQFEFEEFAYENTMKEAVDKYTEPLGRYVAEIYGWEEKDD